MYQNIVETALGQATPTSLQKYHLGLRHKNSQSQHDDVRTR